MSFRTLGILSAFWAQHFHSIGTYSRTCVIDSGKNHPWVLKLVGKYLKGKGYLHKCKVPVLSLKVFIN
jgi:hypothetical protein